MKHSFRESRGDISKASHRSVVNTLSSSATLVSRPRTRPWPVFHVQTAGRSNPQPREPSPAPFSRPPRTSGARDGVAGYRSFGPSRPRFHVKSNTVYGFAHHLPTPTCARIASASAPASERQCRRWPPHGLPYSFRHPPVQWAPPGPRHPRTRPIAWRGKWQSLAARRYLPADTAAGSQLNLLVTM